MATLLLGPVPASQLGIALGTMLVSGAAMALRMAR
jgi:hypothetical protein